MKHKASLSRQHSRSTQPRDPVNATPPTHSQRNPADTQSTQRRRHTVNATPPTHSQRNPADTLSMQGVFITPKLLHRK